MNNARRKRIEDALELMSRARGILEEVLEEEQEAFDALPESFQYGERGDAMQECIDALESGAGDLETAEESIYETCGLDALPVRRRR